MEKIRKNKEEMELPPGFRFHPTDEELIIHYLNPKVSDPNLEAIAIGEADLNKCEPWDLPSKAKMGEREWYFFFARDRKYPTGSRTNRATEGGYYKATGKDKEIFSGKTLVGMKKTLVFYKGRAPRGEKTSWVMHEYRLEGQFSMYNLLNPLPASMNSQSQSEWVICRIFEKSSGGRKAPDYDPMTYLSEAEEHVMIAQDQMINTTSYNMSNTNTTTSLILSNQNAAQDNIISDPNLEFQDSILAMLFDDNENGENMNMDSVMMGSSNNNNEIGTDNVTPSTSGGPVDIDCLWNY